MLEFLGLHEDSTKSFAYHLILEIEFHTAMLIISNKNKIRHYWEISINIITKYVILQVECDRIKHILKRYKTIPQKYRQFYKQ